MPTGTGSAFHNYKGFSSIVLLAVCDANARFLLVDLGAAGSNSDSALYASSSIKKFLEGGTANIPRMQPLICSDGYNCGEVPAVFLADGGFGLSDILLTPFPVTSTSTIERAQFNTSLSRLLAFSL